MIITRFGTRIELLSKADGQGYAVARFLWKDKQDVRQVHLGDLRADGGSVEINAAFSALPEFPEVAAIHGIKP